MNFILSQLIAASLFLLIWKVKELIASQNTYLELLRDQVNKTPKFK